MEISTTYFLVCLGHFVRPAYLVKALSSIIGPGFVFDYRGSVPGCEVQLGKVHGPKNQPE